MRILQDRFEATLKSELSFPKVAFRLITQRFKEAGIELTKSQGAAIAARLEAVSEKDMSFTVEITDAQIANSTLTAEQWRSRTLLLDVDADTFVSRIEAKIPSLVLAAVDTASASILPRLKRDASRMLRERRAERRGFETRLAKRWGAALDLLEMFRGIAVEAGDDFNNDLRAEAAAAKDFTFEVLTRLHARACQVTSEILSLLRSGHADGAHARWRSLHEIVVVGFAALGKERPTFRDIEEAAGLDHLRPYYKMASHNVHANPRGALFRLGLFPDQQMLLAGPSNIGLADPGHGAAISLGQITTVLLTTRPNIDRLVACQILLWLEDEIGEAFLAAGKTFGEAGLTAPP